MADDYTYLAPRDTARILQDEANRCANMGLILARYIPQEVIRNDSRGKHDKYRDYWLRNVCNRFAYSEPGADWAAHAAAVHQRWEATTTGAHRFRLRLQERMVVGLGGKGPLEIGITLHPVTGLPYVPGSALKGMTRAYLLFEIAARRGVAVDDSTALVALDEQLIAHPDDEISQHYQRAFGSQDVAGAAVFYDGVLRGQGAAQQLFAADVMTVHFREYYESDGRRPPSDDGQPNPIPFITVADGLEFAFAVGSRQGVASEAAESVKLAADTMRESLKLLGIGAKTAAGYGVFRGLSKRELRGDDQGANKSASRPEDSGTDGRRRRRGGFKTQK